MSKKLIIGLSAGAAAVVIIVVAVFGFIINSKTNEAKTAASGFVTLLQSGELERLSLEYYSYSEADNVVFRDENGVVRGRTLTKQQVAEKYGVDAVMGISDAEEDSTDSSEGASEVPTGDISGTGESYITGDDLVKVIMKHTQMRANVGTVWSNNSQMGLQMLIPDLKTWLLNLTDEELQELNAIEDNNDFLKEMEERMESGEIAQQYILLNIPMIKQNGKWRFEVTEETEKAFYGGLLNLFDQETAEETTGK